MSTEPFLALLSRGFWFQQLDSRLGSSVLNCVCFSFIVFLKFSGTRASDGEVIYLANIAENWEGSALLSYV